MKDDRLTIKVMSRHVGYLVAAILVTLGMAFVLTVVVPVWRVHGAILAWRGQHPSPYREGFLPGEPGAVTLNTTIGKGSISISGLRMFLRCPGMEDRWIAIELLASYGQRVAPDLVHELCRGTTPRAPGGVSYSVDAFSAQKALISLGNDAIPAIRSRLAESSKPEEIVALLETVSCIPGAANCMLSDIMAIAEGPADVTTRSAAVYAVASAGEEAKPYLQQLLNRGTPETAETAAAMLLLHGWDETPNIVQRVEAGIQRGGIVGELCQDARAAKRLRDKGRATNQLKDNSSSSLKQGER